MRRYLCQHPAVTISNEGSIISLWVLLVIFMKQSVLVITEVSISLFDNLQTNLNQFRVSIAHTIDPIKNWPSTDSSTQQNKFMGYIFCAIVNHLSKQINRLTPLVFRCTLGSLPMPTNQIN